MTLSQNIHPPKAKQSVNQAPLISTHLLRMSEVSHQDPIKMYYSLIKLHKIGYVIFITSFLSPFVFYFIFTRIDHYMVT